MGKKGARKHHTAEHPLPSTRFSLPPPIKGSSASLCPVLYRSTPSFPPSLPPPIEASSASLCPILYRSMPSFPPCCPPPPPRLPVHQRNMEGGVDQAIIDHWQLRCLVRGDGRPGRGRSLAEEDDDEYRWRMDDPPDDVIAAVTRLDERREKTAELSALWKVDHTQHECAAGTLCAAPPGTDVSASAYRCLDCRGKIHCAMWCGENWGEYIESDRCKITPDQLSAAGRASMQGSDHELSPSVGFCINRLESPFPFSSESNGLHTEVIPDSVWVGIC